MPRMPDSAAWTAYDRDLLRSLRIQAPGERPVMRDPKLFCTGLALLVPGLAVLALWIAFLVRMWD